MKKKMYVLKTHKCRKKAQFLANVRFHNYGTPFKHTKNHVRKIFAECHNKGNYGKYSTALIRLGNKPECTCSENQVSKVFLLPCL